MAEPTPEVYEAAARARLDSWGYNQTLRPEDYQDSMLVDAKNAAFRAAVDSAYSAGVAAGRAQAAADIRAHADKWAPKDGNFAQQRVRRHLGIAERVAAGPLTDAEVAQALNEYFAEAGRLRAEGGDPR